MIWRRILAYFQNRSRDPDELEGWTRIGDDQIAPWGNLVLKFEFEGGVYTIFVSEEEQYGMAVKMGDLCEDWFIQRKHQKNGHFKISGTTDTIPEILEDMCWFELILGPVPSIEFFGSGDYRRVDQIYSR